VPSVLVDLIFLAALLIGGAIIILLLEAAIFFLPAIVLALAVWWVTHDLVLAGLAFFVVAMLSIFLKRKK
jgi:hypothetical protein